MKGFKQFLLRGNVVDLAVGVVIGAAFAGLVSAIVKDLLTFVQARTPLAFEFLEGERGDAFAKDFPLEA
jgi:large conductance mechanosensitive channel protein